MEINETTLREHYEPLSSEQLLELYGRGTLTPQAGKVINAVLEERGVPVAVRTGVAAEAQARLVAREHELQILEYLRAPWLLRLVARLIDTGIVLVGFAIGAGAGVEISPSLVAFLIVPSLLYFMFADALPGGQSLGKMLACIAVVDAESLKPCTPLQAIQRNFLVTEVFGLVWILVEAAGRRRPGFGRETMVVRRKALAELRRRGTR